MAIEKTPNENDDELRFENEFLKAKIMATTGATKIDCFPNDDVPLEVENEMLKAIAEWDEPLEDIEDIPIYDFIGRPDFVNEKDLNDELIHTELERVDNLLFEKNIIYSVLSKVDERAIYKFVTEDLFQHLILNMPDSEIGTHYFYEDFHPDHEYDSRATCENFMDFYFSRDFEKVKRDPSMEKIKTFVALCHFYDAIEEFRNVKSEFVEATVVPGKCIRKATISFDAISSAGTKPIHYSGEAIFELDYETEDKCWIVISAQFPGML